MAYEQEINGGIEQDDMTVEPPIADVDSEEDTNTLGTLLKYSNMVNICDDLVDDNQVTQIGRDVVKFTKIDNDSRAEWLKQSETAMEMAMQVVKEKSTPWPNASNVKYPILTVAALQFHARAYPAVVQGNKVVKGQITGRDDTGEKDIQAKNIADHMNFQLLEENESWEEEVDSMLLALPIEGCEFKKTYFDNSLGYNVSEWVKPKDFIVNVKTKSLSICPRMTHRLWFYPHEINEKQRSGLWCDDVNLQINKDDSDEEKLQEFYEQHCYLDLDGDDYKEPYIITVHVDSQEVVRIKACFYPEDITVSINGNEVLLSEFMKAGQKQDRSVVAEAMASAEFVKVSRIDYFTKFSFFPAPDGSFYDMGFGQLVGPLSNSIDTNINQLIDAGTLSNRQGGFIRDGLSIEGKRGNVQLKIGEFKRIKIPGSARMQDSIYQMKFPEPSLVLFQLLGALIESAKEITGIQNIMVEAQGANEPAATSIARLEQGTKLFSAIYKRIYRSLKKEFKKLYKLNGRYLQPKQYFSVLESNSPGVISLADYQNDGTNVQPVADPQLANSLLAMAKAQALMPLADRPEISSDAVLKRYVEALEVPSPDSVFVPQEQRPQGDPIMSLKAMEAASKHAKTQAEIIGIYAGVIKDIAEAESKEVGTQLEQYKVQLEEMIAQWGANEPGGSVPMEATPSNPGNNANVAGQAGTNQGPIVR